MVFTAYPFRDYVIFKLPFAWKTSLYASFCVDKGADNQKLPALFVFLRLPEFSAESRDYV